MRKEAPGYEDARTRHAERMDAEVESIERHLDTGFMFEEVSMVSFPADRRARLKISWIRRFFAAIKKFFKK